MGQILTFNHPDAIRQDQTGGKGVNLCRLSQAGFNVPPGFCVTTKAYAAVMENGGLSPRISDLLSGVDQDDPASVERQAKLIRDVILSARLPDALAADIERAYGDLGENVFVAVRSSGTAEDLADASFAGQHDTYLDVRGAAEVVAAVQKCWASLWTARAVNYRHSKGIGHTQIGIAVVVQKMIRAEVSGVLFTANPLTTATDEIVINATWGLGEALVQGAVTPDQVVVQMPSATVIEQTLGDKEIRIVRDLAKGHGVVTENIPDAERARFCLESPMITSLAQLGGRVQEFYRGFPQDIEWAIEDGILYLLQARPITGVEFSWDIDVDSAHTQPVAADTLWTRAYADALTTGAVSPLTYSTRFHVFSGRNFRRCCEIFGFPDLAQTRLYKYWKGELYYNADADRKFVERAIPPQLRGLFLDFIPTTQHQEVLDAPFDEAQFLRMMLRWYLLDPDTTPTGFPRAFERWRARSDIEGLTFAQLRVLDDEEVIAYCGRMTEIFGEWNDSMWTPMKVTIRLLLSALRWMIATWYDGDTQATFAKLVGGATRRTDTQIENNDLRVLANEIRKSPPLLRALEEHGDATFFTKIAALAEGQRFISLYESWISKWGHRGHADRDYLYPRRLQDPSIDVRAFKVMMNMDEAHDDRAAEHQISRRREEALAQVLANIATKPGGAKKVEMFKFVHNLSHEYALIRDNERARPTDVITFSRVRGYIELGRRLYERGLIEEERDFHFLSEFELYQLLRGRIENAGLLKAKIRARARNVDRMLRKQANMPLHLRRNRPVDLETRAETGTEGVYSGAPTSPGVITGIARVIMDHHEMTRVARGEILVTHSTDPGWNPVFGLISGVVIETGGMLSHASCLAREYGFPAVHLPNAATLLPDGALISVDGNVGTVTVVETPPARSGYPAAEAVVKVAV